MSADPIRVVLADDHAVVRKGIREFLTEPGDIEVVAEAADGAEAIALLEREQPDVAVLDIQMPKRSGIDVCRHVRAQRWPIGVLILTTYDVVFAILAGGFSGGGLMDEPAYCIMMATRHGGDHEEVSAMSHRDEIGVVTARYALRRMRTANPVANMLAPAISSTSGHGEEGRSPPATGSVAGTALEALTSFSRTCR